MISEKDCNQSHQSIENYIVRLISICSNTYFSLSFVIPIQSFKGKHFRCFRLEALTKNVTKLKYKSEITIGCSEIARFEKTYNKSRQHSDCTMLFCGVNFIQKFSWEGGFLKGVSMGAPVGHQKEWNWLVTTRMLAYLACFFWGKYIWIETVHPRCVRKKR